MSFPFVIRWWPSCPPYPPSLSMLLWPLPLSSSSPSTAPPPGDLFDCCVYRHRICNHLLLLRLCLAATIIPLANVQRQVFVVVVRRSCRHHCRPLRHRHCWPQWPRREASSRREEMRIPKYPLHPCNPILMSPFHGIVFPLEHHVLVVVGEGGRSRDSCFGGQPMMVCIADYSQRR